MPKRAKCTRKNKLRGGGDLSQEEINRQLGILKKIDDDPEAQKRREEFKKKEAENEAAKNEWKQDIEKRCYEFYKPYLKIESEWEKKPFMNRMNIFDESLPSIHNYTASYIKEHPDNNKLPDMCKRNMTLEQAKERYKNESSTPQPAENTLTPPASTGGKKSKKTKTSKNRKKRKGSRKSKT